MTLPCRRRVSAAPGGRGRIALRRLLLALLVATAAAPAGAAASPVPEPPELWVMNADGTAHRRVASDADFGPWYSWSPDGRRIAYDSIHGISVVDLASGVSTPLVQGHAPAWSPDGSLIAYLAPGHNGHGTLMVVRSDGSDPRVVTSEALSFPAWSPDGSRIAFHACGSPPDPAIPCHSSLAMVRPDGSDRRMLADSLSIAPLSWSPDGSAIAFTAIGPNVYTVDVESRHLVELTPGPTVHGHSPHWGPDGRVAIARDDGASYAVDPETGAAERLLDGTAPRWSPDGSRIVVVSGSDLLLHAPGTAGASNLTNSPDWEHSPVWSPDGTAILYAKEPPFPTETRHERSVSATVSGARVVGRVTALDGFRPCEQRVPVVLLRRHDGRWVRDARTETDDRGRFGLRLGSRGVYRVTAPRFPRRSYPDDGVDTCAKAVVQRFRYRG